MSRLGGILLNALLMTAYPAAGFAQAQSPPPPRPVPYQRPTVSPYLNLARGGTPALNYYNLVRPQVEFQNSIQRLQQDVATNQQTVAGLDAALTLPATGHATRFMDYSQYFMSQGGRTAQSRSPAVAAPGRQSLPARPSNPRAPR
jgi:hypothetical protein